MLRQFCRHAGDNHVPMIGTNYNALLRRIKSEIRSGAEERIGPFWAGAGAVLDTAPLLFNTSIKYQDAKTSISNH